MLATGAAATPYKCVLALLRCYREEVDAGRLTEYGALLRYIGTLDQGTLGSHACVVLRHVGEFDIGTLYRIYEARHAVWRQIAQEEEQERARMGASRGRLQDARQVYGVGAAVVARQRK